MRTRGISTPGLVTTLAALVLIATIWWSNRPPDVACGERPNRVMCASNLKQIGQAILLYGNENHDAFADSFVTLLRTEDLVPSVFVDLSTDATAAKDSNAFDAGPADCSYLYLGDRMPAGTTVVTVPSDAIVAFDREANHDGDGVNLLFGDGHVEFLSFGPRGKPTAWWLDVQSQIARGARPVMLPAAGTQPVIAAGR